MRSAILRAGAGLLLACALASAAAEPVEIPGPAAVAKPAKELFGSLKTPAPIGARAIGFYSRGCLAGAAELPIDGAAWQAMRLSRHRNFGHPELVALVERLAREAREKDGWPGLLVGDMSQPRGGPMLTGHASHQIGLDADIWLMPMPDRTLTTREREDISAVSVVKNRKEIDPERWTEAHAKLIKRAASYPEVDRIFVHPPIKKALCDWAGNKGAWLAKVRPYYGHNYHFHIRIGCPKDSPDCRNQPEARPKDGTGCGEEIAYWLSDVPFTPKPVDPKKPKPRPKPPLTLSDLPSECKAIYEMD